MVLPKVWIRSAISAVVGTWGPPGTRKAGRKVPLGVRALRWGGMVIWRVGRGRRVDVWMTGVMGLDGAVEKEGGELGDLRAGVTALSGVGIAGGVGWYWRCELIF
jgi:hypothetical protein